MKHPMMALVRAGLALLAIVFALPGPAFAADDRLAQATGGEKVALVIGNAAYPDADRPLTQPLKDARAIADELRRAGVDVTTGENLSRQRLRAALDAFKAKIKPGGAAILFYSGYGIQTGRQSYVIPVDAQIWTEGEVRRDGISIESILADMNAAGAAVKVVMIDASRRNPFERRFRQASIGLAPLNAPSGTLAIYSTATDKPMNDSDGENSLFVTKLLEEMRTPGLAAEAIFNNTRMDVSRATRNDQVPWVSSSLPDVFHFGRAPPSGEVGKPPVVTPPPPPALAPPVAPLPPLAAPAPPPPPPPPPALTERPVERDRVIQRLDDQIERNPRDADAYYKRGQAWAERREYALASEDFGQAIRLNPADPEALNNRCFTRAVLGQLDAALADCNEALRLKPDYPDALDSRGLTHLKLGNFDRAVQDFEQALRMNPRMVSALYGRGKAKLRRGDAAGGNQDMTDARAAQPSIDQEFEGYGVR